MHQNELAFLQKARARLSVTFSLVIAAVLACSLGLACHIALREYDAGVALLFSTAFSSVEDTVLQSPVIKDSWLTKQELANGCLVAIEDNGRAFAFAGGDPAQPERQQLLQLARQRAADAGLKPASRFAQHVSFELNAENRRYMGRAAVFPRDGGRQVTLYYLMDLSAAQSRRRGIALQYAVLWAAASLALALVCCAQVRLSLVPARDAFLRQREFVAAASHELRGPLAVIRAALDAAAQNEPSSVDGYLRTARQEAARLARLTGDLLLLAAGDAEKLPLRPEPVALDTLCIELFEQYSPLAQEKRQRIRVDIPEQSLPPVRGDAGRLRQLLGILLGNAIEYSPEGGEITLRAACAGRCVSVSVIDHGPGVPDGDKERIFERFYRADPSRTGKTHLGLGLSVAAGLAAAHGAQLTVSDTPGGGATFTVRFASG